MNLYWSVEWQGPHVMRYYRISNCSFLSQRREMWICQIRRDATAALYCQLHLHLPALIPFYLPQTASLEIEVQLMTQMQLHLDLCIQGHQQNIYHRLYLQLHIKLQVSSESTTPGIGTAPCLAAALHTTWNQAVYKADDNDLVNLRFYCSWRLR